MSKYGDKLKKFASSFSRNPDPEPTKIKIDTKDAPKSSSDHDMFEFIAKSIVAGLPPDKKAKYNIMFEVLDEMANDDELIFLLAMRTYQSKLEADKNLRKKKS